jgi:hypothetical protein
MPKWDKRDSIVQENGQHVEQAPPGAINVGGIPKELKEQDRWACWHLLLDGKPPIQATPGEFDYVRNHWDAPDRYRYAASDNDRTWTSFESAYRYYEELLLGKEPVCGLSFAVGNGIIGFDLDKCRNVETGEIEPWAVAIMKRLPGYWEISPSGTGLRGFLRGTLPTKRDRKENIAVYAQKFLSVTGRRLTDYGAGDSILDRNEELNKWFAEEFGADAPSTPSPSTGKAVAALQERQGHQSNDSSNGQANGQPKPAKSSAKGDRRSGRSGRSGRSSRKVSAVAEVMKYLAAYVVLPKPECLVVSVWTIATYLMDKWDRFGHLAVLSAEKRCGKTLLLELLGYLVFEPYPTVNINPGPLCRIIKASRPTLLFDEAQALGRKGSESSILVNELFCASINKRTAFITRSIGKEHTPTKLPSYCAKVIAKIGALDGVLADRCFPIWMERKTKEDKVKPYCSKDMDGEALPILERIELWVERHDKEIEEAYDALVPFDIANDRMADLLRPLQAILLVDGNKDLLALLKQYAEGLEERDRQQEQQDDGTCLLTACREIYREKERDNQLEDGFLPTNDLILALKAREEEPWETIRHGEPINGHMLSRMLKRYQIKSSRRPEDRNIRGYWRGDFEKVWLLYLSPDTSEEAPEAPEVPEVSASVNGKGGHH